MATIPTTDSALLLGSSALRRAARTGRATAARLPGANRRRPRALVRASAKEIAFDQGSRASLQAGVEKLAAAVGVTLGPRGLSCCSATLFLIYIPRFDLCTPKGCGITHFLLVICRDDLALYNTDMLLG